MASGITERYRSGDCLLWLWPWPAGLTTFASDAMIPHLMRTGWGSLRVSDDGHAPGAAGLHLTAGLGLLRPEEQAFTAMLEGWAAQQLARRLSPGTVAARRRAVGAFAAHAGAFPWSWSAQLADEWFTDLRAVRGLRASTLRSYQEAVRLFCGYVTDPGLWLAGRVRGAVRARTRCRSAMSGTPRCMSSDDEGDPRKRAFTRDELQALFDYADDQVDRDPGGRRGRAGWRRSGTPRCSRSLYGFGLRRARGGDAGHG